MTTHDSNIVNQMRRRVITISDGKIIGDQKSNGHYYLDAERANIAKRPLAKQAAPDPKKASTSGATQKTARPAPKRRIIQ